MTKGTEPNITITTEAQGYEGTVAVEAPPAPKIWKAYDGRTTSRNPREVQGRQFNRDYVTNDTFKKACEAAETPATKRQASKFRRGFGIAYEAGQRLKKRD